MPIEQSGTITPGHGLMWATNGVAVDSGGTPASERVLGALSNVNFNVTSDQPLVIPARFTAFQLTGLIITNASISLTTAVGGFYPNSSKGGTPIVAASQVYSSLTATTKLLQATLASFGSTTRFSSTNLESTGGLLAIWFSLTTGQGAAATADIYAVGIDLTL